MPSTAHLDGPCTLLGLDGVLIVCAAVTVEIYSVLSATIVDFAITDANGMMPDTVVPDAVGSTMILRITNVNGFCGCGAITTI